jgi:hypothetical protein
MERLEEELRREEQVLEDKEDRCWKGQEVTESFREKRTFFVSFIL